MTRPMTRPSANALLVLHALRIKGMARSHEISQRFALEHHQVEELLLDDEAAGLVERVEFSDLRSWSLTQRGRDRGLRMLHDEVDEVGARAALTEVHDEFMGVNGRFLDTITRWQIRPTPWDAMAENDHADWAWDERVLADLAALGRRLHPLEDRLTARLTRFAGYSDRFDAALTLARDGHRRWVAEPRIDSCHTVWFELHEDLLATLGLERGDSGA